MAHKGMQVGNKRRDVYTFPAMFLTLIVGSALLTEMVKEDSNGKRDGDVELVSSFLMQLESWKTEFGIKRYAQNGEEAEICFSDFLSGLGGSTARGSTGSTAFR